MQKLIGAGVVGAILSGGCVRAVGFGVVFLLGFAMTVAPAHACRCKSVLPYQHIQKYDLIATVKVDETRLINHSRATRNGLAFMTVKRVFKGPAAKKIEVHFDGRFGVAPSHSCSLEFPYGQEFTLFAKIKGDILYTTECALAPARGIVGKERFKEALEKLAENKGKVVRTPGFIKE